MCQVGVKVCGVEGCGRGGKMRRGLCGRCYDRARLRGELANLDRPTVCKSEGCGREHKAKGLCRRCYLAAKKRGDLGGAECKTKGCGRPVLAKGLCDRCYESSRMAKGKGAPVSLVTELVVQPMAGKVAAGSAKKRRKLMPGFNDLQTTHPHLAAELVDPSLASKVFTKSSRKLRWKCSGCAHEYDAPGSQRARGRGCPECAEYGYNPLKPGILYLVRRPGQYKVGIANLEAATGPNSRFTTHKRNGWTDCFIAYPIPGDQAPIFEKRIIKALKAMGAKFGSYASEDAFNGHTETWSAESYEPKELFWPTHFLECLASVDPTLAADFDKVNGLWDAPEDLRPQVRAWESRRAAALKVITDAMRATAEADAQDLAEMKEKTAALLKKMAG